ncbi:hypothetical protein BHUM_01443c [Candidatus Burkholderia humilis]|nr:hypothetical protein BHUM_01443c [Candidatus Burkholderia humilis]
MRPLIVVHPGGGAATPQAYACNLAARIISPPLRGFLAKQMIRASRPFTAFRPHAVQSARPPPGGSQQGRTGATLSQPKGERIMANIGTFIAQNDGFTGTLHTLTLKVKFVLNNKESENAPDFRLQASGGYDIGSAWRKVSKAERAYLSR